LLVLSTASIAEVTEQATTQFYDVSPNSLSDFFEEISLKHPDRQDFSYPIAGLTKSSIKWEANYLFNKKLCKIKSVDIHLSLIYVIPKLEDGYNKGAKIINKFREHQQRIIKHENIHGNYSKESALILENSILDLPIMDTCELLNSEITKVVKESKAALIIKNKELDTRDGKIGL